MRSFHHLLLQYHSQKLLFVVPNPKMTQPSSASFGALERGIQVGQNYGPIQAVFNPLPGIAPPPPDELTETTWADAEFLQQHCQSHSQQFHSAATRTLSHVGISVTKFPSSVPSRLRASPSWALEALGMLIW